VWVPDERHEAMRDLSRTRQAVKKDLQGKRQQISSLMLRLDGCPRSLLTRAESSSRSRAGASSPIVNVWLTDSAAKRSSVGER
jgi:hypothetical protein